MNYKIKNFISHIKNLLLILIPFIILMAIIALPSAFIMKFFGFKYTSITDVILYFSICTILGFPIEMLSKIIPAILSEKKLISSKFEKYLFIILDSLNTYITLSIIDYFMDGISATPLSIIIISLLFAIPSFNKEQI